MMTPQFSSISRSATACLAALCLSTPLYAQTVFTFDGLLDGEFVDAFYAGGSGSLGSGPGPNAGVTMTGSMVHHDSDAGGTGDFGGEPTASSALFIDRITMISVPDGFSAAVSFFYANPEATTEVRVFDSPDRSGQLLSINYFPATPRRGDEDPTGYYSPFRPAGLRFPGTARSIAIVSRGPSALYLDDLTLGRETPGLAPPGPYTLLDLGPVNDRFGRSSSLLANKKGQLFIQTRRPHDAAKTVTFWDPIIPISVELGSFGGPDTVATGINSAGQIVGSSSRRDLTRHAYIWHLRDGLKDLGTLGGKDSIALGVNDFGHVVGSSTSADRTWAPHAFLWRNGVMTDLNDVQISNGERWQSLERAYSISDKGVIVGSGTLAADDQLIRSYFALVPIPN